MPALGVTVGYCLLANGWLKNEKIRNSTSRPRAPSAHREELDAGRPHGIGNRQGQRTEQLVVNCPQVPEGKKTRDIAAKRAGFGSGMTGRRAELAVEQAGPLLQACPVRHGE